MDELPRGEHAKPLQLGGDTDNVRRTISALSARLLTSGDFAHIAAPPGDLAAAIDAAVVRLGQVTPDVVTLTQPALLCALLSETQRAVLTDLGTELSGSLYTRLLIETSAAISAAVLDDPSFTSPLVLKLTESINDPTFATWKENQRKDQATERLRWQLATTAYCGAILADISMVNVPGIDGLPDGPWPVVEVFTEPALIALQPTRRQTPSSRLTERGTAGVLISPAGNGKTTFFQEFALNAATATLRSGGPKDRLVPFIVPLRGLGDELTLTNALVPQLDGHAIEIPVNYMHAQLEAGHGALLLDGYDELPVARRQSVARWVASLQSEFCPRGSVVVVSTRPDGATQLATALSDSTWFLLPPMGQSESRRFEQRWRHSLAAAHGPVPTATRQQRLSRRLPPYRLDAFLALASGSTVHDAKTLLRFMDRVVSMWATYRDDDRGVSRWAISRAAIEALLEELAFEALCNPPITKDTALALVEAHQEVTTDARLADIRAGVVLTEILPRTGLIEHTDAGGLRFRSRQLRTYLAARAAARRPSPYRLDSIVRGSGYDFNGLRWLSRLVDPSQRLALLNAVDRHLSETGDAKRRAWLLLAGASEAHDHGAIRDVYAQYVAEELRAGPQTDIDLLAEGAERAAAAISAACLSPETPLIPAVQALARIEHPIAYETLERIARTADGDLLQLLLKETSATPNPRRYCRTVLAAIGGTANVMLNWDDIARLDVLNALPDRIHVTLRCSAGQELDAQCAAIVRPVDNLVAEGLTRETIPRLLQKVPRVSHLRLRALDANPITEDFGVFPATTTLELEAVSTLNKRSPCSFISVSRILQHFPNLRRLRIQGRFDVAFDYAGSVGIIELHDSNSIDFSSAENCDVGTMRLVNPPEGSLDGLAQLASLESLAIIDADWFVELPQITALSGLNSLLLDSCHEVDRLPLPDSLESLEVLEVRDCPRLDLDGWDASYIHVSMDREGSHLREWDTWLEREDIWELSGAADADERALFDGVDDMWSPRIIGPGYSARPGARRVDYSQIRPEPASSNVEDALAALPTLPASHPTPGDGQVSYARAFLFLLSWMKESPLEVAGISDDLSWCTQLATAFGDHWDLAWRPVELSRIRELHADLNGLFKRLRRIREYPPSHTAGGLLDAIYQVLAS
ncbi:MAG TPA: NACHT domain-containing protein [Cellulomonas sp.]